MPSHGGANKSNRLVLEGLASRGHQCQAIAAACGVHACLTRDGFENELYKRGITVSLSSPDSDVFYLNGVRVTAAMRIRALVSSLEREIRDFDPDWVLVASEDPGRCYWKKLLRSVVHGRSIWLGPRSAIRTWLADAQLANNQFTGIVAASRYLCDYMHRWAGLNGAELPLSPNGPGPFPQLGHYDSSLHLSIPARTRASRSLSGWPSCCHICSLQPCLRGTRCCGHTASA